MILMLLSFVFLKRDKTEIKIYYLSLKDQLIRETIENTAEQVQENSEKLDKIDEKLYEIIQK